MTALVAPPFLLAAVAGHSGERVTTFFTLLMLLIVAGRLIVEWMQRKGASAGVASELNQSRRGRAQLLTGMATGWRASIARLTRRRSRGTQ